MNRESYHAHPALGSSSIKLLSKSFAAWQVSRVNPFPKETDAMDFGTVAHTALLEPQFFDSQCEILSKDVSFSTKEGKAIREEIYARKGPETIILKPKDGWVLSNILENVGKLFHEIGWNPFTEDGESEAMFFWDDPDFPGNGSIPRQLPTGKGMLDRVLGSIKDPEWIFDVKIIASPLSQRELGIYADTYGLPSQAAWYLRGLKELTGKTPRFSFLFASKEPPFSVAIYSCSREFLEVGDAIVEKARKNWKLGAISERHRDPDSGFFDELVLPRWRVRELLPD